MQFQVTSLLNGVLIFRCEIFELLMQTSVRNHTEIEFQTSGVYNGENFVGVCKRLMTFYKENVKFELYDLNIL